MLTASRLAKALKAAGFGCPGGIFADEAGVEFLTGVKQRTLRAWRTEHKGPPATQLARWVYDLEDLADWINDKTQRREDAPTVTKRQIASLSDMDSTKIAG